ncbi:DUF4167 domain-containing protein [Sphingomonas sp.]|uniref:DUF4167 domain-containing protein n=1 Tax=Sphingomonas sp. TaxID=28214 RepID=UPI00185CC2CF|nr:DUF4167 domain-containing protein [Sphingomonas sp.]MBA3512271.1 DUF4167 domain-containing protein [Sphingomonas sp.]
MINNRQGGGRRRGRGGQRPQNLGGRPDGNRQDNRQRGNAAQLLEKYKSMARDAQLGGDRVQTEYYLQYADHYYRVLGESRARFEEQRRQRGDGGDGGDDGDEDDGDEELAEAGDEQRSHNQRDDERPDRSERFERGDRAPRYSRDRNDGDGANRQNREPPRSVVAPVDSPSANLESIPFDALPPAIGRDASAEPPESEEEAARPKRRARRPRAADDEGDVAPAA